MQKRTESYFTVLVHPKTIFFVIRDKMIKVCINFYVFLHSDLNNVLNVCLSTACLFTEISMLFWTLGILWEKPTPILLSMMKIGLSR